MDTSPTASEPPRDPGEARGPSPFEDHEVDLDLRGAGHPPLPVHHRPGRARTPLIVGAAVLATGLVAGALYWVLPDPAAGPGAEPVAEQAPAVPYAGDLLLGEPSWRYDNSRLAQEISAAWTDGIDEVTFTEQVAHDIFDPGVEFLALEREVRAPRDGNPYRNDAVLTENRWYVELQDGTLDVLEGDPVAEPEDVMVLGNVRPRALQYLVRADSDLRSVSDLEGTRAIFSWDDEETMAVSDLVMLAAGTDPFAMEIVSEGEVDAFTPQQALIDGDVDVYVIWDEVPNAEVDHLERQGTEVRVLAYPEEVVEKVAVVYPEHTDLTVEAGTLPRQDEELNLMATWETLYVHADLDEDLAYAMARTVYEELGERTRGAPTATVEQALRGVDPERVHPGAARYFAEHGVL
ncbi:MULTISPECIES: TAXI family TRAP transporter solute-binding subunit [unclassified Nocardiopsis]|uniref:TAXI family TRAP transporter solute-binding subunit n=1 Tax=unclassified Nocardiopsis TaxID=2649073 RepID=UPI00340ADE99